MKTAQYRFTIKILSALTVGAALTGCIRLDTVGQYPVMSQGYAEPSATPAPDLTRLSSPDPNLPPEIEDRAVASLWRSGPESLFGDRRARMIGDILTVEIEIDDRAEFNNKSERSRDEDNDSSISAAFGIDGLTDKFLPSPLSIKPGLKTATEQKTKGDGKINRRERVQLKIAAVVTNILPNGNMVIRGSQEVRVNYELRDLQVSGVVRPHDISRRNTIGYEKIAEARIAYGGRGSVSDIQQPRTGSQIADIILPF